MRSGMTDTVAIHRIEGVLERREPEAGAPVVLDSPHSGRLYPADFGAAAPIEALRRIEDAYVDELFADAPRHGAGLLHALFPRSYIDANRHEDEIDPLLLAEPWPRPLHPSDRAERGLGVVRRLVRPDLAVYDRKLAVAEIEARLERCHRPYHGALEAMLARAKARHGRVWHVNCHSMKALGRSRHGKPAPVREDFVLGDLDGRSCDGTFTAFVAAALRDMGYSVAVNRPFRGAEIVTRHGAPAEGRHSLQIEVNRRLYLDEAAVAPNGGFERLRRDLARLVARVADHAQAELEGRA
jgi:N-formylglutamate amidohydrolase